MNKRTVFFATFVAPGHVFANEWTLELASGDPQAVHWPDDAYAFTLHQREDVTVDGKVFRGEPQRLGPVYYHPDSFIQSLDEVKANPKATSTLIDNMRINGWAQVIWTRWSNWPQPFEADRMTILKARSA